MLKVSLDPTRALCSLPSMSTFIRFIFCTPRFLTIWSRVVTVTWIEPVSFEFSIRCPVVLSPFVQKDMVPSLSETAHSKRVTLDALFYWKCHLASLATSGEASIANTFPSLPTRSDNRRLCTPQLHPMSTTMSPSFVYFLKAFCMLRSCPEYHADIPEILLTLYFFPLRGPNAIFFTDPFLKKMFFTIFLEINFSSNASSGTLGTQFILSFGKC